MRDGARPPARRHPDWAADGVAAASLVGSNLCGVDSHGLQLLPYYIEQIEWGDMDAKAAGCVISESGLVWSMN